MRNFTIFFLFLLIVSCEYMGLQKLNKEELVEKEMKSINWNDVDKYPLFDNCDETASKKSQKKCFQNTLTNHIISSLLENQIQVNENINDTVQVQLLISNEGKISILKIEKNNFVTDQIPGINRYIANSIQSLPKIYPALKRNIPVSTKFNLPIILQVN